MLPKLTTKQQQFVQEYLVDMNATQAAIRAGYSRKTAEVQGPRLLGNVRVAEAIATAMEERTERTKIDADYVLDEATSAWEACRDLGDYRCGRGFLELVGKHVDVQAFRDRLEHTGRDGKPIAFAAVPEIPADMDPAEAAKLYVQAVRGEEVH